MKIAMILGSAPPMPCGVGDNTIILSKYLAEKGHTVEIITSSKASPDSNIRNVNIHPLMKGWSTFYSGKLLKRIVDLKPDVVHLQYPSKGYGKGFAPSMIGMQMRARHLKAPLIVTLHEFSHAHTLRKAAIVPLLCEADAAIFPSVQERDSLLRRFGTLKKIPSHVIPIGAVLPEGFEKLKTDLINNRDALKAKWKIPQNGIIVNYGFIQTHKGIETILKALKMLRSDGYSCEFWHIGKFDPQRNKYHRFLEYISNGESLKDNVKFLGFMPLETASEIFTIARAGVFPFTDGYSDRRSSMITVSFFDMPLITTRSSINEVDEKIKPFVTLIDRNNVKQLKTALEEIIVNDAVYEREKERAKGFKSLYDWREITHKTEDVYRKYLK